MIVMGEGAWEWLRKGPDVDECMQLYGWGGVGGGMIQQLPLWEFC